MSSLEYFQNDKKSELKQENFQKLRNFMEKRKKYRIAQFEGII